MKFACGEYNDDKKFAEGEFLQKNTPQACSYNPIPYF
jgi:hypothetical protein